MESADIVQWRKASRSSNGGASCVEVGTASDGRARGIRDSKSPERGHITVTPATLRALLADVKAGRRDLD
jgi:hypothetical protein